MEAVTDNIVPIASDNALRSAIGQLTMLQISCNSHNMSLIMKRIVEKEALSEGSMPNFMDDIKERCKNIRKIFD